MPALVAALQHGTPEGQRLAAAELESLAVKVDSANAKARAGAEARDGLAEELATAKARAAELAADLERARAELESAPARFESWRAQCARGYMAKAATAKGDARKAQAGISLAHAARLYGMAEAFAQVAHALNPMGGHDSDMADSARLARLAANNAETIPARDMLAEACRAALIDGAAMLAAYAEGQTNNESRGQARATIREMRAATARLSGNIETPKN
jgi:chromosome segregation ATPase